MLSRPAHTLLQIETIPANAFTLCRNGRGLTKYIIMETLITIEETTVSFSPEQLNDFKRVYRAFTGEVLDISQYDYGHKGTAETTPYNELNQLFTDDEYDISVFGDDGWKTNEVADTDAMKAFGCYFNVLIFIDGCNEYFRTVSEDGDEWGETE